MAVIPQRVPQPLAVIMAVFLCTCLGLRLKGVMGDKLCAHPPVCHCNMYITSVDCSRKELMSIPDIPETALALDLSWNNIDKIPTRIFSKLTKLESLNLNGSYIRTIDPLAFEGLESLTTMDLSNNIISIIPTRAFSKLTKLESLDLYYNHIQTIEPLAFEGLESLTTIDLRHNIISIIPTRVFSKLSKLESLDLSYNKIHSVEPLAFDELHNLTSLRLGRNDVQALKKNSLAYIPRLHFLDLSNNKIHSIAAGVFTGTESISMIRLGVNLLSEIPSIGSQSNLQELFLSQNQIVNATFPSTYSGSYGNPSVDLSDNKIETLDRSTFASLAGTTIVGLILSNNSIRSVGPRTFDPPASIQALYLGYNQLSIEALKNVADGCSRNQITLEFFSRQSLIDHMSAFMDLGIGLGICSSFSSGYVFEEFRNLTIIRLAKDYLYQFSTLEFAGKKNVLAMDLAENDFKHFPKYLPISLEWLDLRGNKISRLDQNEISYLGSLKTLLLARNGIVYPFPGAFNGLKNLRMLELNQNRIGSVSQDLFEPLQNLTRLYLGNNRIKYLWKLSNPLVSLHVLDLSDNGCEMIEVPFSELFPSLQILNLESNNLGTTGFRSLSGKALFSGLTTLEQVFISNNNIRELPDLILWDQISLQVLDISKNQISGWNPNTFMYTKNITKLDISVNLIPVLTESNLRDLTKLNEFYLEGNPFVCNCDFLWFREWIDRTPIALPKKESYTCHGSEEWRGKPVLEFTRNKINCPSDTSKYAIVGYVSGTLFVFAVTAMLVYRNRWRLRLRVYLLSKRGRHLLRDLRGHAQHPNYGAINDDGRQDHYDAYISCSDRDHEWVLHHLLPGLDNGRYDDDMFGGDFKLYFDPRDKQPGTMAIANIFEHMSRSRKVIVVLTQNYIDDGMNIFELDQATTLYHDQELDDIIVIKVGDVPARRVPAHIYTQMRTGRFLEWENEPNAIERFKAQIQDRLSGDRVDLC